MDVGIAVLAEPAWSFVIDNASREPNFRVAESVDKFFNPGRLLDQSPQVGAETVVSAGRATLGRLFFNLFFPTVLFNHASHATSHPEELPEGFSRLLDELADAPVFGSFLGRIAGDLVDVGAFAESPVSDCRGGFPTGRVEHSVPQGVGAFFDHVQDRDLAAVGHLGEVAAVDLTRPRFGRGLCLFWFGRRTGWFEGRFLRLSPDFIVCVMG